MAKLPKDTGALIVHAINPYGFAWTRRVNEDNVDLNRNFVDHDKGYPKNDGYLALADAILPKTWAKEDLESTQRVLDAYAQKNGAFALQGAITGGQYTHADGVFYGGSKPTWSNRTIRAIEVQISIDNPGGELKANMKERFFPAGDKWREMVWTRADQTIGWTLKGLTGG